MIFMCGDTTNIHLRVAGNFCQLVAGRSSQKCANYTALTCQKVPPSNLRRFLQQVAVGLHSRPQAHLKLTLVPSRLTLQKMTFSS